MKQILLVEDDDFKARRVESVLRQIPLPISVRVAHSVTSGLNALTETLPDALLLDMSLSTYDVGARESGGRPQNFGGVAILEHMIRRDIGCPVIVITQFGAFERESKEVTLTELKQELSSRFPTLFRGLVFYDSREKDWEELLRNAILDALP